MRLVDADAIKQKYPNRKSLNQVLDAQPTAYDVYKVVKELETAREDYSGDFQDDVAYGLRLAIEILKDGVVNEID